MIPKLLHQTARTREDVSPECRPYVERLKALHPDWTYHLWTDDENLELVRTHVPELLHVYNGLPRNIMRADVIRYVLMFVHGGLYCDTDYEFIKPFDLNHHDVVLPWESSGEFGPGNDRVANAIFASSAGHPFWRMMIDDLIANPPGTSGDTEVLSATGPLFVTRIYHKAVAAGMKIHTPERNLFNPPSPRLKRDRDAIVRAGTSYGIHHCIGSWRNMPLTNRLKTGFWRVARKFV